MRKELTDETVKMTDEIIEKDVIFLGKNMKALEFQLEIWDDVDEIFNIKTKDAGDTWVNCYMDYYENGEIFVRPFLNTDSSDIAIPFTPTTAEKQMLKEKAEKYTDMQYGKPLKAVFYQMNYEFHPSYYEKDLEIDGKAEDLYVQLRNGYFDDNRDALLKLKEIFENESQIPSLSDDLKERRHLMAYLANAVIEEIDVRNHTDNDETSMQYIMTIAKQSYAKMLIDDSHVTHIIEADAHRVEEWKDNTYMGAMEFEYNFSISPENQVQFIYNECSSEGITRFIHNTYEREAFLKLKPEDFEKQVNEMLFYAESLYQDFEEEEVEEK